ncbi:MAG: ATP-dependent helicase [Lachnospiraceae bacterium]|nr:ATP-dependent helicase [Lachnospiraceae bacterium]
MKTPSNQQKSAIMHLSGPAQVIAGPGSGKTYTIIQRILYLVQKCQIDPGKILVITYTKAAAEEMRNRFRLAVSQNRKDFVQSDNDSLISYERVHFGTFHSICFQILRQSGKNALSLISESKKRELVRHLMINYGQEGQDGCDNLYDAVSEILNKISREKNRKTVPKEQDTEKYLKIKNQYEQYLQEQNLLDFDDMIVKCLELLNREPAILKNYQMQFEYILADEFQDINYPQYQILKLLAAPQNHLFVVGDDDQAIYGFRGAAPEIMKQFLADYPEGVSLMLTENYRSGSPIVSLAKEMIRQNKDRFDKQFYPMKEEGTVALKCFESRRREEEHLLLQLKSLTDAELNRTALILRTNIEAQQYQELLCMSGVPVMGRKTEGTRLYDSFVLRDITAFLAFIYNGKKRSDFLGFMNKPNRFLLREAFPEDTVSFANFKHYYARNPEMLKKMEIFWRQLTLAGGLSGKLAVSLFRGALGYDRYLEEKEGTPAQKRQWLSFAEQAEELFQEYAPGTDIQQFLRKREEKDSVSDRTDAVSREGVRICTMHGSKGLEFERVFLPDVNEGVIPGKRCTAREDLEEERRLLYVAITRAEKELEIYYTKERGRTISRYLRGLIRPQHP